jgi:hypothetical protein
MDFGHAAEGYYHLRKSSDPVMANKARLSLIRLPTGSKRIVSLFILGSLTYVALNIFANRQLRARECGVFTPQQIDAIARKLVVGPPTTQFRGVCPNVLPMSVNYTDPSLQITLGMMKNILHLGRTQAGVSLLKHLSTYR